MPSCGIQRMVHLDQPRGLSIRVACGAEVVDPEHDEDDHLDRERDQRRSRAATASLQRPAIQARTPPAKIAMMSQVSIMSRTPRFLRRRSRRRRRPPRTSAAGRSASPLRTTLPAWLISRDGADRQVEDVVAVGPRYTRRTARRRGCRRASRSPSRRTRSGAARRRRASQRAVARAPAHAGRGSRRRSIPPIEASAATIWRLSTVPVRELFRLRQRRVHEVGEPEVVAQRLRQVDEAADDRQDGQHDERQPQARPDLEVDRRLALRRRR